MGDEDKITAVCSMLTFGMDWKKRIEANCLAGVGTDATAKELARLFIDAGPKAVKNILDLKTREEAQEKKDVLQRKVDLITDYIRELRLTEKANVHWIRSNIAVGDGIPIARSC